MKDPLCSSIGHVTVRRGKFQRCIHCKQGIVLAMKGDWGTVRMFVIPTAMLVLFFGSILLLLGIVGFSAIELVRYAAGAQ